MAKVRATTKGYIGGLLRETGEVFEWPAGIKLGRWVEPVRGGVAAAKPSAPAGEPVAVAIPSGWEDLSAADRKAIAKSITGENPPNGKEADAVITAYLAANTEVFADAPAPQTIEPAKGNGVLDALGGTQPDWLPPGAPEGGKPVMTDE